EEVMDMSSFFMRGGEDERTDEQTHEDGKVYSNSHIAEGLTLMNANTQKNDLVSFREFIDSGESGVEEYVSDIRYAYDVPIYVYNENAVGGTAQVNPGQVYDKMFGSTFSYMMSFSQGAEVFSEMMDSTELLDAQFDLLGDSRWPENYNEIVVCVDKYNQIGDYALYTLGLRDQSKLADLMQRVLDKEDFTEEQLVFDYEELFELQFSLLLPTDFYEYDAEKGVWYDLRKQPDFDIDALIAKKGEPLKVVGIIRPNPDTTATAITGTVGYTTALTDHVIEGVNASEIVLAQQADPETDIFTGLKFGEQPAPQLPEGPSAPGGTGAGAASSYVGSQVTVKQDGDVTWITYQADDPQATASPGGAALSPDNGSDSLHFEWNFPLEYQETTRPYRRLLTSRRQAF
ncbi:MAG: hypothetical protein IKY07_05770, partial [Clostridia bacterium]|nr:hypothetical protein [Clostridia bacterium]